MLRNESVSTIHIQAIVALAGDLPSFIEGVLHLSPVTFIWTITKIKRGHSETIFIQTKKYNQNPLLIQKKVGSYLTIFLSVRK